MGSHVNPAPLDVLSIIFEVQDDATVVRLEGPVCAFTAPHLDTELAKVEASAQHRLVVDTSRVRTLSSDGLSVLVSHAERHESAGGELLIHDPSPITRRVLSLSGLERLSRPAPVAIVA